jgi:2',3'-cyclic-nucleotide 2'-phosphodiesterase (5'-nucleotidase family)
MVRNAIADLKERSCDAYLLIGHVGAENFGVLAGILRENPEINAVIGSHSHREVPGGRVAGVFAVQPGAHGSSAVKLELVFDEKRRLQYIRSSILHPQETADPEIMAIARKMKDASAGKSGEVLGIFPDAAGFGRQAAEIIRQVSGAEAAVCGVEITAFRRQVTGKVLFDMMPYGNRICLVTLPREKIMGLLRRKRGGRRYFKAGDLSGKYIRVALSDFLLSQITAPPEAEVLEKFERIEIEKALKAGNITDFNAE